VSRRRIPATVLVLVLATCPVGVAHGAAAAAGPKAAAPAFTKTKTIERKHWDANGARLVEEREFTVSVDQTEKLRSRQLIKVEWLGAHPTLGKALDPNASNAVYTEYPVVLIQCRGDETSGTPIDPSRCFTQTPTERYYDVSQEYPPWRLDHDEPPANRKPLVGYPEPPLPGCNPISSVGRYVPFISYKKGGPNGDGDLYRPLPGHSGSECGPALTPEMVTVQQPDAPPASTTYAVSDITGKGTAKFAVMTGAENASLGCSQSVKCSLVVIPIMGISCDVSGVPVSPADKDFCEKNGKNDPGKFLPTPSPFDVDMSVAGLFWWSASNWKNRITVPLDFGTPSNFCDTNDNREPLDMFGSELMTQATDQWAPAFCTKADRFRFRHVRTGEPQAKAALAAGKASVALNSMAPPEGYPTPIVNAPIGVSGFAVSYLIDNNDDKKAEYTNLRLTPRLIAKALTESYPSNGDLRDSYGKPKKPDDPYLPYLALAHNPLDMSVDPEFIALNPGVGNHTVRSAPTSATMLALSGTSDVIYALTAYLNADPETRAWLDGKPDPWGMVVNPGYRKIQLPQPSWPLLDTYVDPAVSRRGLYNNCLNDREDLLSAITSVPIGPLVAAPVATLTITGQRVQYANSTSRTLCKAAIDADSGAVVGASLVAIGRQRASSRFMLAITSLADAAFLELNTAALQSNANIANPDAKFTNADGRTFVEPNPDSWRAAVKLAKLDPQTHTWPMPYDVLRGAQGAAAYPGTMVIYASAPTTGLSEQDAKHVAQFLRFAVTDGQKPGFEIGQLPPGYLPLTPENGLGDLVAYTLLAADALTAQTDEVPGLGPPPLAPAAPFSPYSGSGGGSSQQSTNPPFTTTPNTVVPNPTSAAPVAAAGSRGPTSGIFSALSKWALPISALVALIAILLALLTRAGYPVLSWLRTGR